MSCLLEQMCCINQHKTDLTLAHLEQNGLGGEMVLLLSNSSKELMLIRNKSDGNWNLPDLVPKEVFIFPCYSFVIDGFMRSGLIYLGVLAL